MSNIVVSCANLSKTYEEGKSTVKAVDNLDLKVKKGTIFGFLGPNGAGKTTTIKLLLGLAHADAGEISLLDQKDIFSALPRIGFMSENPASFPRLTARDLLDYAASLYGIAISREKIGQLLDLVGLEQEKRKLKIGSYSKGMRQRLGLAVALVNDPQLIFLDEPLDGLDPIGRLEVKKILLSLKKQGVTIFFNSHILADAEEICDEVGIINRGKLIKLGPPKKLAGKQTLEEYFVKVINESRK